MYKTAISLHDPKGQRKYLNQAERLRFLCCTESHSPDKKLFCQLIYYTGARITEVHKLSVENIDFSNNSVIFETLKKRKRGVYRQIPLPSSLLEQLKTYINSLEPREDEPLPLWDFSLRSASRYIKIVMDEANINGVQSSSRGLRHGFAVHAVTKVPLTKVQKWLGHKDLETTAIYIDVMGEEERELAKRLWEDEEKIDTYNKLHGLEDKLIQINGLMKALQKVMPDGSAHSCVANALEEKLNALEQDFYEYWNLSSTRQAITF